jgi:hypothetical protein
LRRKDGHSKHSTFQQSLVCNVLEAWLSLPHIWLVQHVLREEVAKFATAVRVVCSPRTLFNSYTPFLSLSLSLKLSKSFFRVSVVVMWVPHAVFVLSHILSCSHRCHVCGMYSPTLRVFLYGDVGSSRCSYVLTNSLSFSHLPCVFVFVRFFFGIIAYVLSGRTRVGTRHILAFVSSTPSNAWSLSLTKPATFTSPRHF